MKRKDTLHDPGCTHANKHHKRSGRCRGSCICLYAVRRQSRKKRQNR